VLSFRLGGTDGVSMVAETWIAALHQLGFEIRTVAGEGLVDILLPDLAIGRWPDGAAGIGGAHGATEEDIANLAIAVSEALHDADLVVVENLGTIPMNLPASMAVARARHGLRTIWHHHDPAWQRDRYEGVEDLPVASTNSANIWRHVAINDLTRYQLNDRGFDAITIRNAFDPGDLIGDRSTERQRLGLAEKERVLVHPVRAIERKNIPAALSIAQKVGATYWLTGPAEEGYAKTLDSLLAAAKEQGVKVLHEQATSLGDLYAACDMVVFPSAWEGFGNPPIEASLTRRPAIVGNYPVANELRDLGFQWLEPGDIAGIGHQLEHPDAAMLENNYAIASTQFSPEVLRNALRTLLDEAGWLP